MKKNLLLIITILVFAFDSIGQTEHTISTSGLTFSPNDLTIEVGDKVIFNVGSSHPVLEVSQNTWNSDGSTALPGGFAFPSGTGEVTFNSEGTHYYICENHISSGMKGKINVTMATDIEQITFKNISIFPNPIENNDLYISVPSETVKEIKITIYDITGRIKKAGNYKLNEELLRIDFSDLSSGVYIAQLKTGNEVYSQKIIRK